MPVGDSIFVDVGQEIAADSTALYECVQLLGVGGNAVTYLVVASAGPNRGVLFAMKVFRRLSDPKRRDAFLNEVSFLKQCDHPAVMRVFDTGVLTARVGSSHLEYPFVIAEYLPATLAAVIAARSASIAQRISYALQLLSALRFLDGLNPKVVHRDIKPPNVFLKGHSCVLGDFGLMKLLDGNDEPGRTIFKESAGVGMPFYYRTPDLVDYAANKASLTTKSDVFQLGLVLAHLFTGRNPCDVSEDMTSPVTLGSIGMIPGALGARIASLLKRMLVLDAAGREDAATLMDGWSELFKKAVERASDLDGRAF